MGLLLALDQGASKTVALVANRRGEILGVGYSGGACHASDGMATAMDVVQAATEAALRQANARLADLTQVVGGLTGADWPHEYDLLTAALRERTGVQAVTVVNDCIIAYRAGTDSPTGAVLCAGSAFNAAIIPPSGAPFIYGYYVPGDDHGGTALGRLALRAAFNAESGLGPATVLRELLLGHFGLTSVEELLFQYVSGGLGETKELVPLLARATQAGDHVAVQIVAGFGKRLARYVTAGVARFGLEAEALEVVLSGGVFKAPLLGLRESLTAALWAGAPLAKIVEARYEPVVGALLLGLKLSGDADSIVEGARRFNLFRKGSGLGE